MTPLSASGSFLLATVVSATLTPLVARKALDFGLFETADGRLKTHAGTIPRLGGVAVVIAFYVPILCILALHTDAASLLVESRTRLAAFLLGGMAIFALGLWDDLRGANAVTKFGVQGLVASTCFLAGFTIERVTLPLFGVVELGPFAYVVTLMWIVGVTNAFNLVDGLDGLLGGIAFFAAVAHVVIGVINVSTPLVVFSAALAGAVLGFLPWNFNPARIFMGDSGSLFLGFMLALSSIYDVSAKSGTAVALLGPILILGLPILDTLLAVARRLVRGAPLFDGDRDHVHHRLLRLGLSERRSVLLLYGLSGAFVLAGLVATATSSAATAAVLAALLLMLVVFERRLGFLRRKPADTNPGLALSRELDLLQVLRARFRTAPSADEAWKVLVEQAPELEFLRLEMSGGGPARSWTSGAQPLRQRDGASRFVLRVPPRAGCWETELVVEIEKKSIRRGTPVADQLFAALLAEYVGAAGQDRDSQRAC